jgi:hypothetical protein
MMVHRVPKLFMDRLAQAISQSTYARTGNPDYFDSRKRKAVKDDFKRALPLMHERAYYWPGPRYFPVQKLATELSALRVARGQRLAAYVSPNASDFWVLSDNCFVTPMMLFGMTGVPLIDGLPPLSTGCHDQQTVSYGFYKVPQRTSDKVLDDTAVCRLAIDRGFDIVARIASLKGVERVVECSR